MDSPGAEKGHASAMCSLGSHYWYGWGVKKDEKEALKWFRKAADKGHASAMYNLGKGYGKWILIHEPGDADQDAWLGRDAPVGLAGGSVDCDSARPSRGVPPQPPLSAPDTLIRLVYEGRPTA
jgi:hypothetical protein